MIRDREVRLIGEDGAQLGIVSGREAYQIAQEKKMDLVKISPNAKPPVCKVMDYGKYKYEMAKREKEAKKKQKTISVKEVRLSLNIEGHDLMTKANNAKKFLEKGDKVKVSLRFKGRQITNINLGREVLDNFFKELEEDAVIEKKPLMEGRSIIMILAPKN